MSSLSHIQRDWPANDLAGVVAVSDLKAPSRLQQQAATSN